MSSGRELPRRASTPDGRSARRWDRPTRQRLGSPSVSGDPPDAQRLQHKERQQRAEPVERDRHDEYGQPASSGDLQDIPQRNKQ